MDVSDYSSTEQLSGLDRLQNWRRSLSVNMKTYSSAQSIGDRVDYWVSADNGTHWVPVESNSTIHFDYLEKN